MLGLAGRLAVWLTAGCAALLGTVSLLAHASPPPDAAQLAALLRTWEDCRTPCWFGIVPGVTGSSEAEMLVWRSGWAADMRVIQAVVTSDRHVRWTWNGRQPAIIDDSRFGQLWMRRGRVYAVEVPLKVGFGAIWSALGKPEATHFEVASMRPRMLNRVLVYHKGWLEFVSLLDCPLRGADVLAAATSLRFTSQRRLGTDDGLLRASLCR